MENLTIPYYDATAVCTYNAVAHFINSNRTLGKTWAFKMRAWKRGLKRGKRTIWLRRFKDEAKEAIKKMYPRDLRQKLGIVEYNPKTKKGNFRRDGNTFYVLRGKIWAPFMEVVYLAKVGSLRSADDPATDTLVFDEYTTTQERYARYHGNEVTDLCDIFFSAKREHEIKCFFLGNNETIKNPYFDYFGIPALPVDFEGIKTFRNGSVVVHKINNPVRNNESDYNKKVAALFKGTQYGRYIYESQYKNAKHNKIGSKPSNSDFYAQIVYNDDTFIISSENGKFYIENGKINYKEAVFCEKAVNKFPREIILTRQSKKWLEALQRAIMYNVIYYSSAEVAERAYGLIKYLTI